QPMLPRAGSTFLRAGTPMSLGFTYSSNTLMMHLQDLVGADKMKSWYERFGFGKKTGGMFDGEAAGNIGWANELQQ
ncbi:Penicillin-binding protein 1, partial [human gut metagenome]